jgi:hypothetical protein
VPIFEPGGQEISLLAYTEAQKDTIEKLHQVEVSCASYSHCAAANGAFPKTDLWLH